MNVINCQALIMDWLFTFLTAFSALVLKPSFSQRLSIHSHLSLAKAHLWNLTTLCLAVTGSSSVSECAILSQPNTFSAPVSLT